MSSPLLTPTSSSLGVATRRLSENLPKRMLLKPRVLVLVLLALIIALLTIHEDSREAAHSALKNVGIPLPDQLPEWELGLDSVKAGLNKWTGSIVGSHTGDDDDGNAYSGSGSDNWRATNDDEEALLNTEWKDIAEPAIGGNMPMNGLNANPNEPIVNKMTYHPENGYLLLPDPGKKSSLKPEKQERHPILELIENAEKKWDKLVKKQSKTLKEAANEYKKRYLRNPPKGFDKWWEYAQKNNIVLKDEYDQIFRDIQPFWAIEPHDLVHRSKVMTNDRAETFTLNIDPTLPSEHKITITGEEAALKRATDLAALIDRFANELPGNVNITFTKHDQPACALGYQHKERLLELVQEGDYFTSSDFIRPENPELSNWANGCPANSPLYLAELGELHESHPSHPSKLDIQRSFIYDHSRSMDICQHPESMHLHGFTSAPGTNLANLVPLFTFAKTNLHSDILATPLEQYSDTYIGYDPVWDEKGINKLLWRGSTTGAEFAKGVDWKLSQRARLHFMAHEKTGKKNVLWADKKESKMKVDDFETKKLNELYMDVGFSGSPVQCDDETCKIMEEIIDFAPTMGLDESYQYKYLMDVDGNGWSGRFHRLMSTKSVVLKSTIFPEWYSERIMPWVHYVPIKVDYSDLYDVMTFFVGTPDGRGSHDEIAAKLAAQGKEWARAHWRKEDMASYMYRLVLEWIRLLHRVDDVEWDYVVD